MFHDRAFSEQWICQRFTLMNTVCSREREAGVLPIDDSPASNLMHAANRLSCNQRFRPLVDTVAMTAATVMIDSDQLSVERLVIEKLFPIP